MMDDDFRVWDRPTPVTLAEITDAIEEVHGWCDSHDSCSCYDRLLAAVRGEPDPLGLGWRDYPRKLGPHDPTWGQWQEMQVDPRSLDGDTQMRAAMGQTTQDMMTLLLKERPAANFFGLGSVLPPTRDAAAPEED